MHVRAATSTRPPSTPLAARLRQGAAILGLLLVVWLVRTAGPQHVLDAIRGARSYLFVLIALEAVYAAAESVAASIMLGSARRRVPLSMWLVSGARAYAAQILLPAGRAVGEAMRSTTLSTAVGGGAAAVVSVRIHARVLLGNATVSSVAAILLRHVSRPLMGALFVNAFLCSLLASVLLVLTSAPVRAWLRRASQRWTRTSALIGRAARALGGSTAPDAPVVATALPGGAARELLSFLAILVGRIAQTVQYGFALMAVAGAALTSMRFPTLAAFAAQGVHVVGATAGDFVPGQLGANEGSFRIFADRARLPRRSGAGARIATRGAPGAAGARVRVFAPERSSHRAEAQRRRRA